MSKLPSACRIKYPTPAADPRYSPTTAPTKAIPTLVCKLEKTQLVAEGKYTYRTSCRGDAPSIRTLASTVGLTSRTPWYTLKKTMKKTSVTPSATLDAMSRPNHTAKIGARITRGIEFSALMYGSSSAEAVGESASHKPTARPSAVPMT